MELGCGKCKHRLCRYDLVAKVDKLESQMKLGRSDSYQPQKDQSGKGMSK